MNSVGRNVRPSRPTPIRRGYDGPADVHDLILNAAAAASRFPMAARWPWRGDHIRPAVGRGRNPGDLGGLSSLSISRVSSLARTTGGRLSTRKATAFFSLSTA